MFLHDRPVVMPTTVMPLRRLGPTLRRPDSSQEAVRQSFAKLPAPARVHEWLAAAPGPSVVVRSIAGRDLGVVAIRPIARGEPIFVEKPLIRLTPEIGGAIERWYGDPDIAKVALSTLSRAGPTKTKLTYFDKDLDPVICTNSFTLSSADGSFHSFVFRKISRLNHSCEPNAVFVWDPDAETATVSATRTIATGAEVLINYGAKGNRDDRQRHLKKCFGFDCECPRCCAEAAARYGAELPPQQPLQQLPQQLQLPLQLPLQLQLLNKMERRGIVAARRRGIVSSHERLHMKASPTRARNRA